ncbi:endonuclease domain-containing protein [Sphaerimonospora cavernae]|uniref:Endonuclease domain-containing protein n=1 Tax=Sphaerimonospora cavernae TaxID=1740611 RepID=A0ABV6U452_9ACTN
MARTWAQLPTGRVVRLGGVSTETITLALEPLPDDAPAIVTYAPPPTTSVSNLVTTLLAEFETAAVELFPSWLPGAEGITGPGGASIPAVRALALRTASASRHFGPFLADLAEQALGSTARTDGKFPHEIRALGLARVLASSFHRDQAAILMRVPQGLSPVGEDILVASSEWLADRGGFGVWLTGAPLTSVDRVETAVLDLPDSENTPATGDLAYPKDPSAVLRFPAVAGMPHPASRAEKALEAALNSRPWAAGRAWNQTHLSSPLAPTVRIDLLWRTERCAVEIDGPEHRGEDAYEADHRRDVRLQLDGYAVLRFTNKQIMNEIDLVLHQLERFLKSRRSGTFKGTHHG